MEGSHFLCSLTTLLLLTIHLTSLMATARPTRSNTQFIKTSCGTTNYPDLCFSTLSIYASKIQTSPKLLATTALNVTLSTARSTSTTVTKLSKTNSPTPREASVLADCVDELTDSVDKLQRSIGEMGDPEGSNFYLQMNDIQTWVSAALTDVNTCMDGFAEMNGNVKSIVWSQIVNVAHLTSNALALVNNYAAS